MQEKYAYLMKIVFISNTSWNLFNFRKELIQSLVLKGYEIHVLTPFDKYTKDLKGLGVVYHDIKLSRFNKTIFSDFLFMVKIFLKIYKIKPNIVHNFTLKPVIYVSIVLKFFKKIKVINSITGLGISFSESNKNTLLNKFILFLIKISFSKKYQFIFQNPDDINFFVNKKLLTLKQCHLVKGSGVKIGEKYNNRLDNEIVTFGVMSRMLWTKGIKDFVDAAKIVIIKNSKTNFLILGSPDPNSPDSIPIAWLEGVNKEKGISWIPHKDDVSTFLKEIDVFVLPTYYPEGVPKSLLEAAAMNLPLITTDTPGCKEIVRDNVNGFLIPPKNPNELAKKMDCLSIDFNLRNKMGSKSFEIVSNEFSIDLVVNKTLKIYNLN